MRMVQVLAELQRVDTALDRDRERLAVVRVQLGDRSALAELEAEHQAARDEAHHKTTEQRDLELELDDLRQKLTTLEKKLYGGTVHNPKELNDMANEAKQFRGLISTREDRLIELYDVVEAATSALAEATARLEAAQAAHADSQRDLVAERDRLLAEIAEHEQRRASTAAESDPQSLRIYDGLRRTRGGLAVAEVAQRTCQGCRISLPSRKRSEPAPRKSWCSAGATGRILHAGL